MEEASVVFKQQTHIVDLVLEKGKSFLTDAKGIAGIDVGIDACHAENVGVNNAGAQHRDPALDFPLEKFDEVMNVNTKGTLFLTQGVARGMIKRGGGAIVNISSISAYTSSTSRAEYCISKAGVSMITQLFADRLAEYGITVNEVRPGIIRTDMTEGVVEKYDRLIENGLLPIKRWGTPEDVAEAVWMLVNGSLPYTTGESISVDGGFLIRRL